MNHIQRQTQYTYLSSEKKTFKNKFLSKLRMKYFTCTIVEFTYVLSNLMYHIFLIYYPHISNCFYPEVDIFIYLWHAGDIFASELLLQG